MAQVQFYMGEQASLPVDKTAGRLYFVTDEGAIYLDKDADTRVRMGDLIEVEDMAALEQITSPSKTALYYVKGLNALAKHDGEQWKQINPDTGAIAGSVEGDGAAGFALAYDAGTRTLKLTVSKTFLDSDGLDAAISAAKTALVGTEGDTSGQDTIKGAKKYADEKIAAKLGAVYTPSGSKADLEELGTPGADQLGKVYNITAAFTTDENFVEGDGKSYPAGTNVVCVNVGSDVAEYKWDALSGVVDLSGYATTSAMNTAIDAAKTALTGATDGVTATTIKDAAKEAKDYADQKITAALTWGEF